MSHEIIDDTYHIYSSSKIGLPPLEIINLGTLENCQVDKMFVKRRKIEGIWDRNVIRMVSFGKEIMIILLDNVTGEKPNEEIKPIGSEEAKRDYVDFTGWYYKYFYKPLPLLAHRVSLDKYLLSKFQLSI